MGPPWFYIMLVLFLFKEEVFGGEELEETEHKNRLSTCHMKLSERVKVP